MSITPIPFGPGWTSPNNRVLIHGPGNSRKTSVALRLVIQALRERAATLKKPMTLVIFDNEMNLSHDYYPKLFGEDMVFSEFVDKLHKEGVTLIVRDPTTTELYPMLSVIKETLNPNGEHHVLIDGLFSQSWVEYMYQSSVLDTVMSVFNGLCFVIAPGGRRISMTDFSLGEYQIDGGPSFIDQFGVHLQSSCAQRDGNAAKLHITKGLQSHPEQARVYSFHPTFSDYPVEEAPDQGQNPFTEEQKALFKEYHNDHPTWGSLHIVMDDGNIRDSDLAHCLEFATEQGDLRGQELVKILIGLTPYQRYWAPSFID